MWKPQQKDHSPIGGIGKFKEIDEKDGGREQKTWKLDKFFQETIEKDRFTWQKHCVQSFKMNIELIFSTKFWLYSRISFDDWVCLGDALRQKIIIDWISTYIFNILIIMTSK